MEGNLRGRNARAMEAHVRDCGDCRRVVEELQRELAPEPAVVRVRFAPARGWAWALAAGAVAALLIVVVLRPGERGAQAPTPGVGPRHSVDVAEVPPGVGELPALPRPPKAPPAMEGTPREPRSSVPPVRRHPGSERRRALPPAAVEPPKEMTAPDAGIVNPLPATSALAFAEPLATHQATTAEVEELLRQGAVNDLPENEAEPLNEALVDEFYQGFDTLVQELRTEGEGAGQ